MLPAIYRKFFSAVLLASMVALCSCGPGEPRSRNEIFLDRQQVDTLYLTEDDREVTAPGNMDGVVVDSKTGEVAWAAYQCDNPDCPGEGHGGRPYLFIWPHPYVYVTEQGTIGYRQPEDDKAALEMLEKYAEIACPACEKIRNRATETADQWQQYQQWVHPYVLPETVKKLERLDEEYRRTFKKK